MVDRRSRARHRSADKPTRGQARAARLIGNFEKAARRMEDAKKRGDESV